MKNFKRASIYASLVIASLLSGCSDGDVVATGGGGLLMKRNHYNETCIGGVIYYENTKRLAAAFNQDGSVKTCSK